MATMRVCLVTCLVGSFGCTVGLIFSVQQAAAETYPLIIKGKVTLPDGSPPPFTAGLERICSDSQGSAPGPTTDKKGEYLWRMDVDPLKSRSCYIHATHPGYVSTSIDISSLNGYTSTVTTLETLVLTNRTSDPYAITVSDSNVPSRAHSSWSAAMKALDARNAPEAATQLRAAVTASPKFAVGWHALGVVQENQGQLTEARDAYEHAIDADPKMLTPYVTLTRLCIKTKDWQGAAKTADALIKADSKKTFPEIYLHQAVARYGLKDLDGAAASAQEAIQRKISRAEYVLGRILEAKGDAAGAREHMSKYLELDKNAGDAELIRAHLQNLGKPDAAGTEPELETL
jgi:Tfp pilus assembly protein PilF